MMRKTYWVALSGILALVSCTEDAPQIAVAPSQLDFGVASTVTPVQRSLTLSNVGFGPLEISEVFARSAAFTVVGAAARSVAAGRAVSIDVEFLPQQEGPVTSSLVIRSNQPGQPEIEVPLVGEGVALTSCTFAVSPTRLDFGFVGVGATETRGFEIQNTGAEDCLLTSVRMEAGSDPAFSVPGGDVMGKTVPAGAVETIDVAYEPTDTETHNGGVEFSISSATSPVNVVKLFGGVGGPLGEPALDPETVDFGNIQVGTMVQRTVFIRNVGSGTLTLEGVVRGVPFSDTFIFDLSDTIIPPNGAAALTINFAPIELGEEIAELVMKFTDPALADLRLPIRGTGVTTTLVIDPEVLTFGNVVVNTTETLPIRITNTSAVDGTIGYRGDQNVKLCTSSVADPSTFCILVRDRPIAPDGSFSLGAGEATTIEVQFTPVIAGTRERGSFVLGACESPVCEVQVRLDGLGIESGFRCSPPTLDFGQVAQGMCRTQTVTCENIANAQITVVSWGLVTAGGIPSSTDFQLEPPQVRVLNQGDTVDVDVAYCPTNAGMDTGTLGIETDNRDARLRNVFVPLAGES